MNKSLGNKPKFLVCYLCGREFGSSSLEIHMRQCVTKLENEKGSKVTISDEYEELFQRLKDNQVSPDEYEALNEQANNLFKQLVLCPCPNCGRKFMKDRLEVHLRSCDSKKNKTPDKNTSNKLFMEKLEKELGGSGKESPKQIKPLSLICYLCGKEYGTTSLKIHLKTCEVNYLKGRKSLPGTLPDLLNEVLNATKALDLKTINEFNTQAEQIYKQENLIACPNCGRKFLSDRLQVHLKGCKSKGNSSGGDNKTSTQLLEEKLKKQMNEPGAIVSNKPLFMMCFLCGREFGKNSLEIHLKTCMEKFTNEDPKRKMPKTPEQLKTMLANVEKITNDDIINYNETANKIYKEYTMKACPGCKRRFLPDRLEVHLKSCNSGGGGGGRSSSVGSPKMSSRPRMLMCPLCGKEYGSLSLSIHMKTCKVKFEQEQQTLPKAQRKSADTIIEKFNQMQQGLKSTGQYNLDQVNAEAFDMYNKEALVPCDMCGRTFLPDRLIVHQRSCKKK